MNWESNKTDRIVKRYWSGVMEFRIGCETERCACVRKCEESEVEHLLRRCVRTGDWRRDWRIGEGDEVETILQRGDALEDLESRRDKW